MRRRFRLYLLLCGLAFNTALVGLPYLDVTGKGFIGAGADKVVIQIEARHPRLGGVARDALNWVGAGISLHADAQKRAPRPTSPDRTFAPVPIAVTPPARSPGRVLRVGPGTDYPTPAAAARAASDGDLIEIAPGDYPGDTAVWSANGLTIRGDGGIAWLDATGTPLPELKAIWIIKGNNTTVENIAFLNARSPDRNGAGIRQEGNGLVVRNCYFFSNEDGILAGGNKDSEILIEHSEFAWNGHEDGQAHNVYIGAVGRFTFRFNYAHHPFIGSNVKSRARENRILYNRIMDERDGYGNYAIDLSNGGLAFVIGNVIEQGPLGENFHLLTFAPEGASDASQALYVVNNTFVNDRGAGVFIRNGVAEPAYVYNNVFVGPGTVANGEVIEIASRRAAPAGRQGLLGKLGEWLDDGEQEEIRDAGFANPNQNDYSLAGESALVDAGARLDETDGMALQPAFEYGHPRQGVPRPDVGPLDIGAYEMRR